MKKRELKPYVGVLLIILYAVDIFWFSDIIAGYLGMYGTFIHEAVLLVTAVGVTVIFGGDLKTIFPFQIPEMAKVFGTLIFWMGTFWGSMMVTMVIAYFFPSQYMGVSQGLGSAFTSVPFLLSLLMIAVTPAVCEEAAFRGALLGSFRGIRNKWVVIAIVSVVFGIFHGSIWRFIPTALLGAALAYLLFETDNMFYNMLFHMVNNMLPLILLEAMQRLYHVAGMENIWDTASQITAVPLASVGVYFLYGGAAPFFIYIGNYLIHKGSPGYDRGLFPREKRGVMIGLIIAAGGFTLIGAMMLGTGFF